MDLSCPHASLLRALRACARQAGAQRPVLLEAGPDGLAVVGTDQDATHELRIPVLGVEPAPPEAWVANGTHLAAVVGALPQKAPVRLTVRDGRLEIRSDGAPGAVNRHIPPCASEDVPRLALAAGPPADGPAVLPAAALAEALAGALAASVTDNPGLRGALLEAAGPDHLRAVATDGSRMHLSRIPCARPEAAACPRMAVLAPATLRAMVALLDLDPAAEAHLWWPSDRQVALQTPAGRLIARAAEGEFPAYRSLGPFQPDGAAKLDTFLIMDRVALDAALVAVMVLLTGRGESGHQVILTPGADGLTVEGKGLDRGEGLTVLPLAGGTALPDRPEPWRFGVNPSFLREALRLMGGVEVELLGTAGGLDPLVLRRADSAAEDWQDEPAMAVLMPVRLD